MLLNFAASPLLFNISKIVANIFLITSKNLPQFPGLMIPLFEMLEGDIDEIYRLSSRKTSSIFIKK